jgi:radical SAM superfamily enzyme YgiQ (UPF0313 family)
LRFERPDIIRPPSEWDSYYLPLTSGCSNNTCSFCSFYGAKLHLREEEEVIKEIDALSLYVKKGVRVPGLPNMAYSVASQWNGRKIFLQDGDALIYPQDKLERILDHLEGKFPVLDRVASYATPQDILRRSVDDLRALKQRRLGIIYMGVESGDAVILKEIGKGVTPDQLVEAGNKVKASGILLSVTVILGLGGPEGSLNHSHETARILTKIDPDFAGALTLMVVPGTPVEEAISAGRLKLLDPFQSLDELRIMVAEANFSHCFFSSMHASNYFALRGVLPDDRERMLRELDAILHRRDPGLLRPEFMRGL